MRGNYDRRAPLASSQIITLERMLEESESRNEELKAELEDTVTECLAAKSNEDIMRKQLAELLEDVRGACGCTDGNDIRNHLQEYLQGEGDG